MAPNIGIIGGADGPTAVLVNMGTGFGLILTAAVIAVAVMVTVIVALHFKKR